MSKNVLDESLTTKIEDHSRHPTFLAPCRYLVSSLLVIIMTSAATQGV